MASNVANICELEKFLSVKMKKKRICGEEQKNRCSIIFCAAPV
jgi:hypothetical protein